MGNADEQELIHRYQTGELQRELGEASGIELRSATAIIKWCPANAWPF